MEIYRYCYNLWLGICFPAIFLMCFVIGYRMCLAKCNSLWFILFCTLNSLVYYCSFVLSFLWYDIILLYFSFFRVPGFFCTLISLLYDRSFELYYLLYFINLSQNHRTFVLFVSFVFYDFLSQLRFLKYSSYFSFVDVFILPYLSLFVIWQSEHIFDWIFIYFLFYQYKQ